jgi:two-component system OmpR family sensor kinase
VTKRGASLHARLTLGVLLLTALGLLLAGTASSLLLRNYLVGQVDQQLLSSPRFADRPPQPGSTGTGSTSTTSDSLSAACATSSSPTGQTRDRQLPSPFVITYLTSSGTVACTRKGSQVADAPTPDIAGLTLTTVQSRGGQPFDVTGIDSSYGYRALATPLADGSGIVVIAVSTESINGTMKNVALASLAVGLLTLGLVGLLSGWVIGVGLRPLDDVERTAERIAAGDLSQRVPDMPEGTEIGRLATSLNGMLGQIEEAFDERAASEDRLRRFVADASHELRTPLTSIRGYAELTRAGAFADEADRARAIGRIEEEAARMGVLVDDLLLLARLDQQRPLERAPLDVVEVVEAAAEALRAAAPDRVVTVTAPVAAAVMGDPVRLRQVLDNLCANARVHTTAGSPVELDVRAEDTWVRIDVRDHGPGMAADEVSRAFTRFYRGDPSRTRARGGGTGLGLSIAQAVVEAHGGTVSLASTPDDGTTVTLRLPAAPLDGHAPSSVDTDAPATEPATA